MTHAATIQYYSADESPCSYSTIVSFNNSACPMADLEGGQGARPTPSPFAQNLPLNVCKTQVLRPQICECFAISGGGCSPFLERLSPLFEIFGSATDVYSWSGAKPEKVLNLQKVCSEKWGIVYKWRKGGLRSEVWGLVLFVKLIYSLVRSFREINFDFCNNG